MMQEVKIMQKMTSMSQMSGNSNVMILEARAQLDTKNSNDCPEKQSDPRPETTNAAEFRPERDSTETLK